MFNCGNGKFWFQGSVSPAKTGSRVWYTGQFRFQGQCWNWLQDVITTGTSTRTHTKEAGLHKGYITGLKHTPRGAFTGHGWPKQRGEGTSLTHVKFGGSSKRKIITQATA